jgi:hypothetical protein
MIFAACRSSPTKPKAFPIECHLGFLHHRAGFIVALL